MTAGRIAEKDAACFAPGSSMMAIWRNTANTQKPNIMNTLKNNVRLVGNLGHDPEVREIAKGRRVARMSVATNESYRNANGEVVTDTQWHTVVAWGSTADQVKRLLRKGSPVSLEGKLVHRSFAGKDGVKRSVTEVVMSSFAPFGKPGQQEEEAKAA
jgi:single-strand DNA-binding protein